LYLQVWYLSTKMVDHARKIDQQNGNTLWWDAAAMQEMANVRITFQKSSGTRPPIGFHETTNVT
jgi:hypothetical protein